MAVYQVPQFLDSGDKIFLGLNIRQFAYALGGLFSGILIYSFTQSLVPGIGNFAIIPCIPIMGLFAYLAWGKYNGRDSEIYVLKFILHSLKPRRMVFRRVPDVSDLNDKFGELNERALNKKLEDRVKKQEEQNSDKFYNFDAQQADIKAERIRNLGSNVDTSLVNTLTEIRKEEYKIKETEALLQRVQASNLSRNTSSPFKQLGSLRSSTGGIQNPLISGKGTQSTPQNQTQTNPQSTQNPAPRQASNVNKQNSQNFFDEE